MAEPFLSSPEPTTAIPYRQYSFDLPLLECAQVFAAAERFAPPPPAAYFVQIQFTPTGRRWIFKEQNVVAWIDRDGVAGPDAGLLSLPLLVLDTITSIFDSHESVDVHIDHDLNCVTVRDDEVEFTIDLPLQRPTVIDTDITVTSHVIIKSGDLAKIGSTLVSFPVAIPDPEELESPLPFLDFNCDGRRMTVRRDWSQFDGPALSVTAPVLGDALGEFSAFPQVLVREFCVNQGDEDIPIMLSLSEESPNLMRVSAPDLTMRIELGHEDVFWHRGALVAAFEEDGLEVVEDGRIGWDPTVRVVFEESVVDATITSNPGIPACHIRMSCLVVKDSPWNLDIAAEINGWNNQWGNVKLIRHSGDIIAVCDLPIPMIPAAAAVARDLDSKSSNVREVIGVFL